jgi:hypothetical protein
MLVLRLQPLLVAQELVQVLGLCDRHVYCVVLLRHLMPLFLPNECMFNDDYKLITRCLG